MGKRHRKRNGAIVRLPVTGGSETLVDPDVADALRGKGLWRSGQGYVGTRWRGRAALVHRVVCPARPGEEVDHINHDKADNRRSNLRAVTPSHNQWRAASTRGRSGWRGVAPDRRGRFRVQIQWRGRAHRRQAFASALISAFCRDDLARRVTGLREGLNFPACIKGEHLPGFLAATRGKLFSVVFVRRRDGEVRRMVCRLGVHMAQTGAGLAFDPSVHGLFSVYDVQKRAYRFLPLENVLCLTCNRKRYRVTRSRLTIAA